MIQRLVQRYTQGQRQAVRGYGSRWRSAHSGKQSQGEKKDKDFEDVLVEIPPASALITKAMSVGAVPIALFHSPLGAEKGYPDILN
jgi:hypothetical protein